MTNENKNQKNLNPTIDSSTYYTRPQIIKLDDQLDPEGKMTNPTERGMGQGPS